MSCLPQGWRPVVQPSAELLRAIRERKVIAFIYDGLYREVEPYVCGVFHNGCTAVVGYQVGGYSRSGSKPPWRTFAVEKIQSLQVTERSFLHSRPEYNPEDPRLQRVFAQVEV